MNLAILAMGLAVTAAAAWEVAYRVGLRAAVWVIALVMVAAFPYSMAETPGAWFRHVGISTPVPAVSTFGFALILLAVCSYRGRLKWGLAWFTPLAGYLILGALFVWDKSSYVQAGLLHWVMGILAFGLAASLATRVRVDNVLGKTVFFTLATIVFVHFGFSVLQVAGFSVKEVSEQSADWVTGRVNGLTPHPNTLGKLLLVTLPLLLPYTRAISATMRQTTWVAIAVLVVNVGLTGGRANFLATLSCLLLWAVAFPGRRMSQRLAWVGLVAACTALFAQYFLERFLEDPTGGSRATFANFAWQLHHANPWFGLGPNNYVAGGAWLDPYIAAGYVVHNALFLTLVELGWVGALLAAVPLAYMIGRIIVAAYRRVDGVSLYRAQAFAAALPGLLIVATTGFGLAAGNIFLYFMILLGFSVGGIGRVSPPSSRMASRTVPVVIPPRSGQLHGSSRMSSKHE